MIMKAEPFDASSLERNVYEISCEKCHKLILCIKESERSKAICPHCFDHVNVRYEKRIQNS